MAVLYIYFGAISVADEDILIVYGVCGAVACRFPFGFVALKDDGAATQGHIVARAVEIGSADCLASAHSHAIVALGATATVIPRHKEIVILAMFENEGGLDGIGTSLLGCGVYMVGYFDFSMHHAADAKLSMLGRIGGAISFIFSPLGLSDWRCCVALISGLVARETTVSTLGILIGSAQSVRDIISPQAACAFMSFSLLSMPCVAAEMWMHLL